MFGYRNDQDRDKSRQRWENWEHDGEVIRVIHEKDTKQDFICAMVLGPTIEIITDMLVRRAEIVKQGNVEWSDSTILSLRKTPKRCNSITPVELPEYF